MKLNRMLLVGATQKHIGKTSFSTRVIEKMTRSGIALVAAKITVIREGKKTVHGWVLDEETGAHPDKDTGRMLSAGATKVFWLRCEERFMREGMAELLEKIGDVPLVAESNSIRHIVEPSLFIMIRPTVEKSMKSTAEAVLSYSHIEVRVSQEDEQLSYMPNLIETIHFSEGKWIVSKI